MKSWKNKSATVRCHQLSRNGYFVAETAPFLDLKVSYIQPIAFSRYLVTMQGDFFLIEENILENQHTKMHHTSLPWSLFKV